jgi:hypothetical protein
MKSLVLKGISVACCCVVIACGRDATQVRGSFTVNDQPKSGVLVYFVEDFENFGTCGNGPVAAVTDSSGKFRTEIVRFPVRPCFVIDGVVHSSIILTESREPGLVFRCELPFDKTRGDTYFCNILGET